MIATTLDNEFFYYYIIIIIKTRFRKLSKMLTLFSETKLKRAVIVTIKLCFIEFGSKSKSMDSIERALALHMLRE